MRSEGTHVPGWSWAPRDEATSPACRNPTVCVEALTAPYFLKATSASWLPPCGQRAEHTFRGRGGARTPDGLGPALRSTCDHVLSMTAPNEEDTEARRSSGTCSKLRSSEGGRPGSRLRPAACRAHLSNRHALAGSSLSVPLVGARFYSLARLFMSINSQLREQKCFGLAFALVFWFGRCGH